jgi:hypothetical protein
MMQTTDGVDWSAHYSELVANGYKPVDEFTFRGRTLRVGMRVSHRGQQYADAYRDGTATLAAILVHPPDQWEQDYWGRPNVEVIAITDTDRFGSGRVGRWADYHCQIAENQPDPQGDPT